MSFKEAPLSLPSDLDAWHVGTSAEMMLLDSHFHSVRQTSQ